MAVFQVLSFNHTAFTVSDLDAVIPSATLSLEHDLAVYDAYFLALAQALEMPLITADQRMLSRLTTEDGALSLGSL